ncbi:MAG: CidA/LrgA family protein, partial [Rhodoferax sp.]|nr:CidA/LrgA family protein [Rhodoferax sp.]
MPLLTGLAWLLLCQTAGELLARLLQLPLPGPVLGMLLLLVALRWPRVRTPVGAV